MTGRVNALARTAAFGIANRLPAQFRSAFLRFARRVDRSLHVPDLRLPRLPGRRTGAEPLGGPYPTRFQPATRPADVGSDWPEPPTIDDPTKIVTNTYAHGAPHPKLDIELFESLNAEYASNPVVPEPLARDPESTAARARERMLGVHKAIDLAGKRVLEIGCGAGYEVWYLSHQFGSEAYGIDVVSRRAWDVLADERTHYECADMTASNPFAADFFDRVISFTVWEHVVHPYKMIREMHRVMKPGGLAWVRANLHRSALASHLYREIFFPYPHLLFSDDVIREFYRRRGEHPRGASWVNHVTWSQYERYFAMAGFRIRMLRFSERELDEAFYKRFEDVLARYPRFDLTKDFFTVVLEKPI
jgi:SAM-dependent methyltransferase